MHHDLSCEMLASLDHEGGRRRVVTTTFNGSTTNLDGDERGFKGKKKHRSRLTLE